MGCRLVPDHSLTFPFGSCIDFDIVYRHPDGTADDISDDRFLIVDCTPEIIGRAAVLTKPDPAGGVLHFHLPAEAALQLFRVDANRLRILRACADGCDLTSSRFGILVL